MLMVLIEKEYRREPKVVCICTHTCTDGRGHMHKQLHTWEHFIIYACTVSSTVNIILHTYALDDDTIESTIEEDKGILSEVKRNCA